MSAKTSALVTLVAMLAMSVAVITLISCGAPGTSEATGDLVGPGGDGTGGYDDGTGGSSPPGEDGISDDSSDGDEPPSDDADTDDGDVVDPDTDEDSDTDEPQSGLLTAGSFDDNLNLDVFTQFLTDTGQAEDGEDLPGMTIGQRVVIRVTDNDGEPVNDARIVVSVADPQAQAQPLIDLPTGSDGRVLFLTALDGAGDAINFSVSVYPPGNTDEFFTQSANLDSLEWNITLPDIAAALPTQLDLLFVVDVTGSMSDELEYLKTEVESIANAVKDEYPDVDQHYGLIVYRDEGDLFITRPFDFTGTLSDFQANLADQSADGGGDEPEAMHTALQDAAGLSWRTENTARVLFLIADAPPHIQYAQNTLDVVGTLREKGVSIYPVAASGTSTPAEYILRSAALLTLGQYLFLTDDSGVGNSHEVPHIPCYEVQRLDQLIIRMIATELAGERVEAREDQIIRTVGNPVNGVCEGDTQVVPGQEQ